MKKSAICLGVKWTRKKKEYPHVMKSTFQNLYCEWIYLHFETSDITWLAIRELPVADGTKLLDTGM